MEIILSEKCFNDFIKLIYELTGITIGHNRNSMVESRLRKRLIALKLTSYEDYLILVKEDKTEKINFINLVTTNETYFYRTPRVWEYIEKKLLPCWVKTHSHSVFKAWSAAASSGEEAHTLGIFCQEFKEKFPSFHYEIIGTDISNEMLNLCQKGQYSDRSVESIKKLRPNLFQKYIQKSETGSYRVISEIKNRLKFMPHNLFHPAAMNEKFDLILIRNVLIYFKATDQEKVIFLLEPKIAEDGIMIIGESETLAHINTNFASVEPLIYKKHIKES